MNILCKRKKAALAVALLECIEEERKKKCEWSKQWLLRRNTYTTDMSLLRELVTEEPGDYKNYLRMNQETHDKLLEAIRSQITKQDTLMRDAINAETRLAITLRFLATGRTYKDLQTSFRVSHQRIGKIVPETCWAIYNTLKRDYLKLPTTEEEWKTIAAEFKEAWNFDNCIGAMDGKHIEINKPPGSGSLFFNYKGTFSVVLFAVVNAKYEFIYVHTGVNGKVSDGGLFQQTKLSEKLERNELCIPSPHKLSPHIFYEFPYVFLADQAFPLRENIMKPYPEANITHDEKIFNYRLSRARRIVENAFGILASKFRVFHTSINLGLENIDAVVLASCVLHNYVKRNLQSEYITPRLVDSENHETGTFTNGLWREIGELNAIQVPRSSRYSDQKAKIVRDNFKRYFNTVGKVDFQEKMIH